MPPTGRVLRSSMRPLERRTVREASLSKTVFGLGPWLERIKRFAKNYRSASGRVVRRAAAWRSKKSAVPFRCAKIPQNRV
jgi:hypothetical protein